MIPTSDEARFLLNKWAEEDRNVVGWLTIDQSISVRLEGWLTKPDEVPRFFLNSEDGKRFVAFDLKDCVFGYEERPDLGALSRDMQQNPFSIIIGFPSGAKLVLSTNEP